MVIDQVTISQDFYGRYCLNDLHKAAGGAEKDDPYRFFRLDSTEALVNELLKAPDMGFQPLYAKRGNGGGTFVVKELVYAYQTSTASPSCSGRMATST